MSKLKLIKLHLGSTMEIEKLNNLAILSIEKGMVPKLEYTSFNNDVESQKTRTKIRIMLSMLFV